MSNFRPMAALLALAVLPAVAGAADDVSALRAELQALKSDYSARVDALEARIQQLEASPAAVAAGEPLPSAPAPLRGGVGASAFNPAISLILGGSYTRTSRDPADWNMAGFPPNGGEVGPGERSFNLGESELTFSASIDPYFAGQLTAAITGDDEIEVEEAFVRTTALPDGFTGKLGRFFSGFGYLNEVHAHAWDFVDQPLVYQALFGGQFQQNGVQVKWLAPTDLFIELGAETGNGDGFPSTRRARNGLNGATLFAHVGGDVGDYTSWRAGRLVARPARRRARRWHRRRVGRTAVRRLHRRCAHRWSSTACSSGRRRRDVSSRCRANTCAGARAARSPTAEAAARRRLSQHVSPAGTCRASINSRRAGARVRVTTHSTRAFRATRWRQMGC